MKEQTETWLSIADEDFKNMRVMKDAKSLRGTVLFAQQAVEKLLKAYICEYTDKRPRRIHHLEILAQDAELDMNEINNPDLKELSKAYGWARYSDLSDAHFRSIKDIEPLLVTAETVYLWIHKKFQNT